LSLEKQYTQASEMVQSHIQWAIEQQQEKQRAAPVANRKMLRLIRSIEKGMPRDA